MKKILIAIVALLCCGYSADAQIKVNKKSETKEVFSSRMGFVTIKVMEGNYFLALPSSNQYDDYYIMHLGQSNEDALESVEALLEMAQTIKKGESYAVETLTKTFTITKGIGKSIDISAKGYAGYASTSATELKGMIDALRKQ